MMFETISIIGFTMTLAVLAVHCIVVAGAAMEKLFGADRRGRCPGPVRMVVYLLTLLLLEKQFDFWQRIRKLVYLLALLCFVVLVVTGFYPRLVLHKGISGYWMMVHTTAAGIFAGCLAVLAVMWAHRCRFEPGDWPWLHALFHPDLLTAKETARSGRLAEKITFWIIVSLGLVVILSITFSMLPLFGTDLQELLLTSHRYGALVLALTGIVHTYLMVRTQIRGAT